MDHHECKHFLTKIESSKSDHLKKCYARTLEKYVFIIYIVELLKYFISSRLKEKNVKVKEKKKWTGRLSITIPLHR